eukprot:c8709_g1_i1.p1 GENE.c8709_g1_i1~~c8709_g1_i1.p1  ORF type:complete len:363 (+),score=92.43 c8709_g1_i1:87-1175(+)
MLASIKQAALRGPRLRAVAPVFRASVRGISRWQKTAEERMFEVSAQKRSDIVAELLFYRPHQLLLGVTIGGLGATFAGLIYFQSLDQDHKLRKELSNTVHKIRDSMNHQHTEHNALPVPLPVLTTLGWAMLFVVTSFVAWNKAQLRLKYRMVEKAVNLSLNSLRNGHLCMRTINEVDIDSIFVDNPGAVSLVLAAARRTTPEQPFLTLPNDNAWFITNSVVNAMSAAVSPVGYFYADANMPYRSEWYRLAITFEKESLKGRKLRVIAASEALLYRINSMPTPNFENEFHKYRWEILCHMGRRLKDPDSQNFPQMLGRMEVILPYPNPVSDHATENDPVIPPQHVTSPPALPPPPTPAPTTAL